MKENIYFINAHPDDLDAAIGLAVVLRDTGRFNLKIVDLTGCGRTVLRGCPCTIRGHSGSELPRFRFPAADDPASQARDSDHCLAGNRHYYDPSGQRPEIPVENNGI